MDFLKNCATNVLTTDDFSVVGYWISSLNGNSDSSEAAVDESSFNSLVNVILSTLLDKKILASLERDRRKIWIFVGGGKTELQQDEVQNLALSNGLSLRTIHIGEMQASELCETSGSGTFNSASSTPLSASTPSSTGRHPQPLSARTPKSAVSVNSYDRFTKLADTFEPSRIYRMFITAVLSLIAYALASSQTAMPLGGREFLTSPYDMSNSHGIFHQSHYFYLSAIYVQLTLRGHLILSFSSKTNSKWKCIPSAHEKAQLLARMVRLAPCGIVASILGIESHCENVNFIQDDPSTKRSSKRCSNIIGWKRRVTSWLHKHGLQIEKLDSECCWLWVELPRIAGYLDDNCQSAQTRSILWPAQLCFYPVESRLKGSKNMFATQPQNGSAIFDVNTKVGLEPLRVKQTKKRSDSFQSSLRLAEEFLLETISAEPGRHDDYVSRPAESSSPIQTRFAQHSDLQLPNGVYPTPPDCVTGPPTSLTEVSNTTTAIGKNSTHSAIESPSSDIQSYKKANNPSNTPTKVDDQPNAFEAMETSENELFGETDRDEIEANGITDADFNFFDEPDVDMDNYTNRESLGEHCFGIQSQPNLKFAAHILSKESAHDTNQIITPGDENPGSAIDEARLLASLETTPSLQGENIAPPTRTRIKQNVSHTVNQLPQNDSEATESPFSFDILHSDRISGSKKGNLFDPMSFNGEMTISDGKYSAEGRYDFNRKDSMHKEDESNTYTLLAARTNHIATTESFLLKSPCISQSKEKAFDARLPASNLSQGSDNENSQSDFSSRLDSEPSDSEDGENIKFSTLSEKSPLLLRLQGFNQEISRNEFYFCHPTATADEIEGENVDSLDAIEGILDSLQLNIDDGFSITMPSIPATSLKDLVQQNLTEHHADENSISSSIKKTSHASFNSNTIAQNIVQSVQVVVDQIAKGTWELPHRDGYPLSDPSTADMIATDIVEDRLLLAVKQYALPMTKSCNIAQFASLDYFPFEPTQFQKSQARSLIRRSSVESQTYNAAGSHIFQMPAPLLRTQRCDSILELSPSSLAFWEALGLAPANGPKNLHAYCVCADNENKRELADNLLTSMTTVYEGCRLGIHARGSDFKQYRDGIIPFQIMRKDEASYKRNDLQEAFYSLGRELADVYCTKEKLSLNCASNIVLYVIYPLDKETSLWHICSSFQRLQQEFQRAQSLSPYAHYAINITLQLTPFDRIASQLTLQTHHYMRLACEVYDRCRPAELIKDNRGFDIFCAPSLQLAESLPKSIPFRLSPDPPSDLLNETACMHVAYAKSMDDRWMTAAWTDNSGKRQAHVTYNLEGNQSFNDVAKEMWQTTSEIIQRRRVTWKVIIVAVTEMVREDIDVWIALVTTPTQPIVFTLLLSIGLDFPLRLSAKGPAGDGYDTDFQEKTVYSPVSNVKQAEAGTLTPTSTPNGENLAISPMDLGGNLIDINDETWAVVLAHRSNVSRNLSEYRPSLASGLLVKRIEDNSCHPSPLPMCEEMRGPLCVALDLLRVCNSSGNGSTNGSNSAGASSALHILGPRGCDHMLREILFMYGSLGLLAKYRGMSDTRGGLVPWHVVMVTRGIKVLENCLT